MRYISVITNGTCVSEQTKKILVEKFENHGFTVLEECSMNSELLVCIGGDGALLHAVHM